LGDEMHMLAIAQDAYPPFDANAALEWARSRIALPDMGFFFTDDAFGISSFSAPFNDPNNPSGYLIFLGARRNAGVWSAYRVLKRMLLWAQDNGCSRYIFQPREDMSQLEVFARRLKGNILRPTYSVPLKNGDVHG